MSLMPDGNTAALRTFEREQEENERRHDEAMERAYSTADEILTDAECLNDFDRDYELWTGKENMVLESALARCFANLHQARKGEQIGIDAITTALTGLYATWRDQIATDLEGAE